MKDSVLSGLMETSGAVMKAIAKQQMDVLLAPWKESRPYRWAATKSEKIAQHEYRGHVIVEERTTWTPPEKERPNNFPDFFGMDGKPPPRMSSGNSTIAFVTKRFGDRKFTDSFASLAKAKAYIDSEMALDESAPKLKALIKYLKGMPCTCGEYGWPEDRDILRHAAEIVKLARKA